MLSTGTDIILRPYDPFEDHVSNTPFEAFMAALGSRYRASAKSMASAAEWTAFPYEQAVADGLWLVFIRTAERLGLKLATSDHVTRDIAPRVNRVLNGALPIAYKTMEEAAEAFDERVAQSVAYDFEPATASEAWALESAKFFVDIIRAGHDMADKIMRLARRRAERNRVRAEQGQTEDQKIYYLLGSFGGDNYASEAAKLKLDWNADPELAKWRAAESDKNGFIDHAAQLIEELKRSLSRIKKLEQLPVWVLKLPYEVMPDDASVEGAWIPTQILLAVLDAPVEQEFLVGSEYHTVMRRVSGLSDAEVKASFRSRMLARKSNLPDSVFEDLSQLIDEAVGDIRLWNSEELELSVKNRLFIDMRGADFSMGGNLPTDMAMEFGFGSLERYGNAAMVTKAVESYPWQDVTSAKELKDAFDEDKLEVEHLLIALPKLRADIREEIINFLRNNNQLGDKHISELVGSGKLVLDARLALKFPATLSARQVAQVLPDVLEYLRGAAAGDDENLLPRILPLLDKLDTGKQRTRSHPALVAPEVRQGILMVLMDAESIIRHADYNLVRQNENRDALKVFRRLLSKRDWQRYHLCHEIIERKSAYGLEVAFSSPYLPPWSQRHEALPDRRVEAEYLDLPKELGLSRAETRKLLRTYKEDSVFCWLFKANPDLRAELAAYQEVRRTYYAKYAK